MSFPSANGARMEMGWIIFWVVLVIALLGVAKRMRHRDEVRGPRAPEASEAMIFVEYRGEKIHLRRPYDDYDDYKSDPDNLDPSEIERVGKLVAGAPLKRSYRGREAMLRAVFGLEFPGYGITSFGRSKQADDSLLEAFAIEIPRASRNRYVIFRGVHDRYTLLDDFVASNDQDILRVRASDGQLVYSTLQGKDVLTRPITVGSPP
jgi:hypothetical protein